MSDGSHCAAAENTEVSDGGHYAAAENTEVSDGGHCAAAENTEVSDGELQICKNNVACLLYVLSLNYKFKN